MSEKGSDELLAERADLGAVNRGHRLEQARTFVEEWRVRQTPPAEDEPGADHPDPDAAPPADQAHDEFDPVPPEG